MNVSLVGPDPSGLASILAELLRQNLERDPDRAALLRPTVAVLDVPDAEVTVFLRIDAERVRVGDSDVPDAHLRIRADAERVLTMTNTPLRFGLPDVMRSEGRALLRDLLTRRVRITGLLLHPLRLARLTSLLSVAEDGSPA